MEEEAQKSDENPRLQLPRLDVWLTQFYLLDSERIQKAVLEEWLEFLVTTEFLLGKPHSLTRELHENDYSANHVRRLLGPIK